MNGIFNLIISSSKISSVLIVLIILLRSIFKDRMNVQFLNILWLMVLVRLLLPFEIESGLSIYNLGIGIIGENIPIEDRLVVEKEVESGENIEISRRSEIKYTPIEENQDKNINRRGGMEKGKNEKELNIKNIVPYIWLAGLIIYGIFIGFIHRKFSKEISNYEVIEDEQILALKEDIQKKLKIDGRVRLYTGDIERSPFLYGIVRPIVYLPKNILKNSKSQELGHILLHELTHYRRKDNIINMLGLIALGIHFFNPLVWLGINFMKLDRELACDEELLKLLSKSERLDYGHTLIGLAQLNLSDKEDFYPVYFGQGKKEIKRRVTMISRFKELSIINRLLIILLAGIIGVGLLTSRQTLSKPRDISKTERKEKDEASSLKLDGFFGRGREFTSLDRALDFIDILPELPRLNEEFQLKGINVIELGNTSNLSITIASNDRGLFLDATENDLLSRSKLFDIVRDDFIAYGVAETIEDVDIEDIKFGGKKGKLLTNRDSKLNTFVWEKDGIYYKLQYFKEFEDDARKLIGLFKILNEEEIKEYKTDYYGEKIEIYRDRDLKEAENILGFIPKLALELKGGYRLERAKVDVDEMENEKLSPAYIVNSYFHNLKSLDIETREEKISKNLDKLRGEKLSLAGQQVYYWEELSTINEGYGLKNHKYAWEEDGRRFQITFRPILRFGSNGEEVIDFSEDERLEILKEYINIK